MKDEGFIIFDNTIQYPKDLSRLVEDAKVLGIYLNRWWKSILAITIKCSAFNRILKVFTMAVASNWDLYY